MSENKGKHEAMQMNPITDDNAAMVSGGAADDEPYCVVSVCNDCQKTTRGLIDACSCGSTNISIRPLGPHL